MAIIGVLNTLLTANSEQMDKTLSKSGDNVGKLTDKVKGSSTTISDSFRAAGQLSGLGDSINSVISKITKPIGQVATIMAPAFNAIYSGTTKLVSQIVGALSAAWSGITSFVGMVSSVIMSVGKVVATTLISAFSSVVTFLAAIPGVGPLLSAITIGITGITVAVTAMSLGSTILSVISAGWASLTASVASAWGATTAFFASFSVGSITASNAFAAFMAIPGSMLLLASGALAAAAAVTGLSLALNKMANAGAESIKDIRKLAIEVGMTTQQMAAFGSMGGMDPERFTRALLHMQAGIANFSADTIQALAKINLNPEALRGMGSTDQLRAIADAFSGLSDQGTKASVAMALFGAKVAGDLLEPLSRGSAYLDMMAARADRFGLTFSNAQALAVKNASIAWKGFGSAMEGIGRQAAIMFAPLWETLGKIGGEVGEFLVNRFKEFASVVGVAMPAINAGINNVWAAVKEGAQEAMQYVFGFGAQWGLTFDNIREVTFAGLSVVVAMMQNLRPTWEVVKNFLRLTWLQFIDGLAPAFSSVVGMVQGVWNSLPQIWQVALDYLHIGWLGFIKKFKDSFTGTLLPLLKEIGTALYDPTYAIRKAWGALTDMESGNSIENQLIRARNAVGTGMDGIRQQIEAAQRGIGQSLVNGNQTEMDRLRQAIEANGGNIAAAAAQLQAEWRAALQGIGTEAQQQFAVVAQVADMARSKAFSGHEAITAGSEKAFSLLYGGKDSENVYQKQLAEGQKNGNAILQRIEQAVRGGKILRRAAI